MRFRIYTVCLPVDLARSMLYIVCNVYYTYTCIQKKNRKIHFLVIFGLVKCIARFCFINLEFFSIILNRDWYTHIWLYWWQSWVYTHHDNHFWMYNIYIKIFLYLYINANHRDTVYKTTTSPDHNILSFEHTDDVQCVCV